MSGLGGPQLFRDISLSMIAAVGIAKIQLTIKKKKPFYCYSKNVSERVHIAMIIILYRTYEQLTPENLQMFFGKGGFRVTRRFRDVCSLFMKFGGLPKGVCVGGGGPDPQDPPPPPTGSAPAWVSQFRLKIVLRLFQYIRSLVHKIISAIICMLLISFIHRRRTTDQ